MVRYLWATILLLAPLQVFGAGVVINEIAWMGSPPKAGETNSQAANNEWLELKNETGSNVDVTGWRLEWRDGEYGITFGQDKCVNTAISAGGYFLLERTDDTTVPDVSADCIYTGALSNSGERLFLKDAAGNVIDEVNASSEWLKGDKNTKQTMQRVGSDWITATSTPRLQNHTASTESSQSSQSSAWSSSASGSAASTSPPPAPTIKAFAGEDRTAVAGANMEFIAHAIGLDEKPLDNARFWWNFGDGGTKEGRAVSHIFQIPGKYSAGLHVSSGSYSASDYLTVTVIPNQIKISDVLIGEEGYVRLSNPANVDFDIGGWILEDGERRQFVIPVKTRIGALSEIAFGNRITGLFENGVLPLVILRYPNAQVAAEWAAERVKIESVPVPTVRDSVSPAISRLTAETISTEKLEQESGSKKGEVDNKEVAQISGATASGSESMVFLAGAFFLSLLAAASFFIVKKYRG